MTITPSKLYEKLKYFFGEQNWWPVDKKYHSTNNTDPRIEIIIGAILTQNTAWINVEQSLDNLKRTHNLSIQRIIELPDNELKKLVKSSGYYNQKTDRLKTIMMFLFEIYNSDLSQLFSQHIHDVRTELLSINGIGPETADSILLYAGNYPIFVVDAYTIRISKRLPIIHANDTYDDIQHFFEDELSRNYDVNLISYVYQQLHAMIVELAKNFCKIKPVCLKCPLKNRCGFHQLKK
jgi:endonuclease-3 related protein